MLISEELNEAFNGQIGNEFGASLQYVEIASYFENDDLPVLARHFFQQSNEERDHAMRLVRFVLDAGGQVRIPSIPAPRAEFASAEEAVGLALEWENTVTDQIDGLMDLRDQREQPYRTQHPRMVRQRAARGSFQHGNAARHGAPRGQIRLAAGRKPSCP